MFRVTYLSTGLPQHIDIDNIETPTKEIYTMSGMILYTFGNNTILEIVFKQPQLDSSPTSTYDWWI